MKAGGRIRNIITLLIALSGACFFLDFTGIGCPIRFLTGVSCAGCGMTRAVRALLVPDIAAAFRFHPLVFLLPPAAALMIFRNRIPKKAADGAAALFIFLFLAVYLIRLSDPAQEIVSFHPERGLWFRIIRRIFTLIKGIING